MDISYVNYLFFSGHPEQSGQVMEYPSVIFIGVCGRSRSWVFHLCFVYELFKNKEQWKAGYALVKA
ncbi:MAG: hypothetical protein ACXITV_01780 [Luteibaculaceae bacterium]